MIKSPIYSFVDFEDRLSGISLQSYKAQFGFQFYFVPGSEPLEGGDISIWVADTQNNLLFQLNATVIDACAWGIISGLDGDDFPIVVGDGEIIAAGTYETIYDLWDAFQEVGISANSEIFLQCCKENLQDYTLTYTTAANTQNTININFYRGVVYVDNTGNTTNVNGVVNDVSDVTPALPVAGAIESMGIYETPSDLVDGIYNNVPLIGGTGTGASINATVSGGRLAGWSQIGGSGYSVNDNLTVDINNIGGSGTPPEFFVLSVSQGITDNKNNIAASGGSGSGLTVTINNDGSVTVVNGGSGYTVNDDVFVTLDGIDYHFTVQSVLSGNSETLFEENGISIGDCYKLAVQTDDETVFSNTFKRVDDTKYLAFLSYYNNEDGFEFYYPDDTMQNKLWLPFYLRKPDFVITRKIYRRSDKTYKVQFSTIEKESEGTTDYLPRELHERLVVALEHDNKHVTSTGRYKFDADVFMNSDYAIAWQASDIYDAPLAAQATFKVLEYFAGRNSNCERRSVCIPLPTQGGGGGGGDCVAVGVTSGALPAATAGQDYSYDIPYSGDDPVVLSGPTAPGWMAFGDPSGGVIHVSGTPSDSDVGTGISIGFHLSNCSGNNSADFSGTIDVQAAEQSPDGNSTIHNGVNGFEIEDVIFEGHGVCTPYTNFPLVYQADGTWSCPYDITGHITVRFNNQPLPDMTLEIVTPYGGESNMHTGLGGPTVTSDNTYIIHAGDSISINVF